MIDPIISAQVVMRSASPSDDDPLITSANVAEAAPPPEAVDTVRYFCADAGFAIGPFVGISFSIAGPASLFETVFGERPRLEERASVQQAMTAAGDELSLDRLPPEVGRWVRAVTFTPPPDFGPTGFAQPAGR